MKKEYLLIYLADEIKPKKISNYLLTSMGLAPYEGQCNKANSFLLVNQILDKNCCYDSSYNIYYLETKYIEFNQNIKYKNTYKIIDVGELKSIEDNGSFLDFLIYQKELYIFDYDGNYLPLLYFLIKEGKLTKIYCKKRMFENMEVIKFYFKSRFSSKDPILQEGINYGFIGDYKDSNNFSFGEYDYNKDLNSFPLLMWPRDNKEHENKLEQVNYQEFIKHVHLIKEFEHENYKEELNQVSNNGGSFYLLKDNDEVIGIVCLAKKASTYFYVSYLGIVESRRKTNASLLLVEGIKKIAQNQNKNLILTIENNKAVNYYLKQGFKSVGLWKFD